eukprot:TRINITY_DN4510_c0_g1_i3.p1 TRINITY_DN4510_c0_g1~~TRINITY_DN4510_c0_g1_i3.p1  ORF type:complete len:460 (-),score=114.83 TRINITY_DN4510_c0_g1_i3:68-1375(-)
MAGPKEMLIIPPRHYCIVKNPVVRDDAGNPVFVELPPAPEAKDAAHQQLKALQAPVGKMQGQVKLRHGDLEIRYEQETPFPLYPGESLHGGITQFTVVAANTALKLRAHREFEDEAEVPVAEAKEKGKDKEADVAQCAMTTTRLIKVKRQPGDEWLFMGPATYKPRIEIEVVAPCKARVILPDTALKVQAVRACTDYKGVARKAGEQWLVKTEGAYMPAIDETIVETVKAQVLTAKVALQLHALESFTDRFDVDHKKGEEWLVTMDMTETYIPDVPEEVVNTVNVTTLTSRQYCVLRDYYDEHGVQHFGALKIVRGEKNFFLQPGESIVGGLREIIVLGEEEALELVARETYEEEPTAKGRKPIRRSAGTRWMVEGPCECIPPTEVVVVRRLHALVCLPCCRIYTFEPLVSLLAWLAVLWVVWMLFKLARRITGF